MGFIAASPPAVVALPDRSRDREGMQGQRSHAPWASVAAAAPPPVGQQGNPDGLRVRAAESGPPSVSLARAEERVCLCVPSVRWLRTATASVFQWHLGGRMRFPGAHALACSVLSPLAAWLVIATALLRAWWTGQAVAEEQGRRREAMTAQRALAQVQEPAAS
jgi:hypothetical protein